MKGFIDLQVNGYVGIDFSAPRLTAEKVYFVTRKLIEQGTIAYCPTIVTSSMDVYRENLPVIAKVMKTKELAPHILGIHMEGPFISSLSGARGAHNRKMVQTPDIRVYEEFQELASGKIVIVTLAPEMEGAEALVRHITRDGTAIVSLGHHMADKAQIEMACKAGARACTHLGNGIPNILPRHTNPIWVQMAEDSLIGMFITDGHHLPPEFIKVALRGKTPQRFIVTSDMSAIAGMPPGTYEIWGQKIVLEESGRLKSLDSDYLAGSSSDMMQCMNFLASLRELTEDEIWQVGFTNPLKLINKDCTQYEDLELPEIRFVENRFVKES